MKHLLLASIALVFALISNTGAAQKSLAVSSLTSDWQLYHSQQGVNFYVKTVENNYSPKMKPLQVAVVKVENTTGKSVNVSYSFDLLDAQGCINCGSENQKAVTLAPKQTLEGNPENQSLSCLYLNPNFSAPRTASMYKLSNLKIK